MYRGRRMDRRRAGNGYEGPCRISRRSLRRPRGERNVRCLVWICLWIELSAAVPYRRISELTMGEELLEQVLRHNADVAFDLVIQDQARRHRRFILTSPPPSPPPIQRSGHNGGCSSSFCSSDVVAATDRCGWWVVLSVSAGRVAVRV